MSLAELTRNCFQSGISPSKWIGLCRLFISKNNVGVGSEDVESALSNSVLVLYRSYPGDPDLQEYLKCAIQDGMLSVAVFVATLLQAARSPELHNPATLDMLCRIALDSHYSSGLSPIGSVVSYSESPIVILGTVQDGLAFLRTAHLLPTTHFHQLTTSASELVILLLSCVTDISQISTAQAMVHFADANDMLQNFRLSPDVRQVLETFVISLSLLIGDDAKVAREAQMMQSIQLALGKGDILGPSSNSDIITFSLVLQHLVAYRGSKFGSGSDRNPVSLLLGILRWTSWSPSVFYTQLLVSAFTCLSQTSGATSSLWKAFIVGRLPPLLVTFERVVKAENTTDADWRAALQTALLSALRHSDLIAQCDHVLSQVTGPDQMQEDLEHSASFTRDFLQQLLALDLIEQTFAVAADHTICNDATHRLNTDAQDAGLDLEAYLRSKLSPEISLPDVQGLINRVWKDPGSHSAFAEATMKLFASLTSALDVEALSHLCKILYLYDAALDMVSLHVSISDLIFQALLFLEKYDCETVGDPQTAVSHLGDIVLFAQSTISRFHLGSQTFTMGETSLSSVFLRTTDAVQLVENLSEKDAVDFSAWFKALFDSSSEGIEDTILRSTQPKTLLRISATLFSHAISVSADKKMDSEVLNNGVSYFLGPLLNWTLVGVVKALVREIHQKGFDAPAHLEILQTLLLAPSCPRPVLCLCGPRVLSLLDTHKGPSVQKIDANSIRREINQAVGNAEANPFSQGARLPMQDSPRHAIREAIFMARSGKAPSLDIDRCIQTILPSKFIHELWSELVVTASLGEMEACRRVATFALTMPRSTSPNSPPLLPIFIHNVVPFLVFTIDEQQPASAEQNMNVELLVTIVSSVLTAALHLEWALHTVSGESQNVLGESSGAMARRLAFALKGNKESHTSQTIAQRLTSSQSFVANFPVFMGELTL